MVKVICIGTYDNWGRFCSENWYEILNWLERYSDSLIIYCRIDFEKIGLLLNHSCSIDILESPDKSMNINAYKLFNLSHTFWDAIKQIDYCIDSKEEISHLFFMFKEQLLCMLNVVDYENYMLINILNGDSIDYTNIISDVTYNQYLCSMHIDDINSLVDGEEWSPC